MFPSGSTIRWCGRLLSGWCLLATLLGAALAPAPHEKSQTVQLAAHVAPRIVDFSDTALQQSCLPLIHANLQVKFYIRAVTIQEASKSTPDAGRASALCSALPDVISLLTLGVALRL